MADRSWRNRYEDFVALCAMRRCQVMMRHHQWHSQEVTLGSLLPIQCLQCNKVVKSTTLKAFLGGQLPCHCSSQTKKVPTREQRPPPPAEASSPIDSDLLRNREGYRYRIVKGRRNITKVFLEYGKVHAQCIERRYELGVTAGEWFKQRNEEDRESFRVPIMCLQCTQTFMAAPGLF